MGQKKYGRWPIQGSTRECYNNGKIIGIFWWEMIRGEEWSWTEENNSAVQELCFILYGTEHTWNHGRDNGNIKLSFKRNGKTELARWYFKASAAFLTTIAIIVRANRQCQQKEEPKYITHFSLRLLPHVLEHY